MVNVVVITPIGKPDFNQTAADELRACSPPDVSVEVVSLESGPPHIECLLDEAACIPGVLKRVEELDGRADAFIVNCFADPGVRMAREATRVPVVGPGEASMCMASLLGTRTSVVTVLDSVVGMIWHNVRAYGLQDHVVSVRSTGMGVDETVNREGEIDVVGPLAAECLRAVEEDKAEALVLGCTGMAGLSEELSKRLLAKGHDIPVIAPTPAALFVAYYQVRLGLAPYTIRCK